MLRHYLTLSSFVFLAGCAHYVVANEPSPHRELPIGLAEGRAEICVVRASRIGFALTVPVRDNGVVVGATRGRGHFCYPVTAGLHVLEVEVSDAPPIAVDVTGGRRYYVECEIRIGRDELRLVPSARGEWVLAHTLRATVVEGPEGDTPLDATEVIEGRPTS